MDFTAAAPRHAEFDTFFGDSEYFSDIEFCATSSQDRIYLDYIHVTLWHTDAHKAAMVPECRGIDFTA